MPRRKDNDNVRLPPRSSPPSTSPEGRENEVIALAYDLAEQQIRNGTASSQVLTHFLKLGSSRDRLEREILAEQKKLVSAKTSAIESQKRVDELYLEAMKAFSVYSGDGDPDENLY